MVPWADPGGEYYFSLGAAGAVAAGLWASVSAPSNAVPNGRATVYGITVGSGATKNLGANYVSFIFGIAYYINNNNWVNQTVWFKFLDSGNTQVDLRNDGAGHLFFTRSGTQIGSTSTQSLNAGWHYFEVKVTINSTTGFAEVRVDGVTWITVSGVNTQATANAFMQSIGILGQGGFLKDMYFVDTTTGVNTNYLGDVTVGVSFVNASGANTQWTPNPGANANYVNVQDGINHTGTWPDGDTTYNSSSTAGQLDDYAHQSISLTGSILCVLHVSYLRKDDAGSRTVAQYVISGSSGVVLSSNISLGNSYLYYFQVLEQDPNGNISWTVTAFNNMTGGCKLVS